MMWRLSYRVVIVLSVFFHSSSFANGVEKQDKEQYQWSGLYLGGNLGIVKHTMNVTDNQATTFNATLQEASNPQLSGGLQLGYRHQLDLNMTTGILGLEFSSNFSQAGFQQNYGSPYALYQINAQNELKNVYLLELMGGIAVNKTLLFLGAGFSWSTLSSSLVNSTGAPYFESYRTSNTPFGTVLSGGLEYAFYRSLSVRFKLDVVSPNTYMITDNFGNHFQNSNVIVQGLFGVNYQF